MKSDGDALRSTLYKRGDVFRALAGAPASKPELVDRLLSSRSTVDRAVADLADVDCVESRNGTYSLTAAGRLALAEHDRYAAATRTVERAAPLLNGLLEDVSLPSAFLDGATVAVADPHAPSEATTASSELLEEATVMRGLAPTVLKPDVFILNRELDREGLDVTVIAEPDVVEALSALSDTPVAALLSRDSFSLYRSAWTPVRAVGDRDSRRRPRGDLVSGSRRLHRDDDERLVGRGRVGERGACVAPRGGHAHRPSGLIAARPRFRR